MDRDEMDLKMGFPRYDEGPEKIGWMVNMHPTLVKEEEEERAACDYYFLQETGESFKCTVIFSPYFYISCFDNKECEVEEYMKKKYPDIDSIEWVEKEDLQMLNHLSGLKRTFLKIVFKNMQDLLLVRKDVLSCIKKNKQRMEFQVEVYHPSMNVKLGEQQSQRKDFREGMDLIMDCREYDVPYYVRVAMDNDFRVGVWYKVSALNGTIQLEILRDKVLPPDPIVLAFDIETTKLPLKFPDSEFDQVIMISYVVDGQGFLITNREIVSEDIMDFEYTPKPEYESFFQIFNERNEYDVLYRFFTHCLEIKPQIYVTYNGDFFDWPFLDARATKLGLNMEEIMGVKLDDQDYTSFYATHQDCFKWVKRDSYLPAGSHGLKAVTKAKLGYNPMEVDPELMVRFAMEKPQTLAEYSVSDAVATYYLYMKYVHPFVFSLCNVIPMNPDEVLRRGSGTLCESLLMVQAQKANVIMPNKHLEENVKYFEKKEIISETYVGGHVEALEAGVFRMDLPCFFETNKEKTKKLAMEVRDALKFCAETELNLKLEDILNFEQITTEIEDKLMNFHDNPERMECPLIYHLDVAAMYPNIILTNRLQPDAIVTESTCASCDYNLLGNCKRALDWSWRVELKTEKRKETKVLTKTSVCCQRENPFYINTVRNFRDRRYEYKNKLKLWKQKQTEAQKQQDLSLLQEANKMIIVMDSLQLAHKCILNSFYGYVMRKGSRWYSMEMGGIVCLTGSKIIQMAREQVEAVGRPLELDTDGIWCILPFSFPDKFHFQLKSKKVEISYPCVMLNYLVNKEFSNHQYQDKIDDLYVERTENSIFFEIDGPYRAMILPASTEEDRLLKKRYAVFAMDGKLAELKGFEVKRRGELKLIKNFQSQIFPEFLKGSSLLECYGHVAKVSNAWLDVLDLKGKNMVDEEIIDLISENKSMSKSLDMYEGQKSTSITTAKRLSELLGPEMVKNKLACQYIIALKPLGAPTAERAIPVAILHCDLETKLKFLKKWLKDPNPPLNIRQIIDWEYYRERFSAVLQKLITIPASMQKIANPIERVKPPEWLRRKLNPQKKQQKLTQMFDIEDMKKAYLKKQEQPKKEPKVELQNADKYKDYINWLKYQKEKWKKGKQRRNYYKVNFGMWDVIQVEQKDVGLFLVWIMVNNIMQSVQVEVPRIFYINSLTPIQIMDLEMKKTKKTLPRGEQSFELQECRTLEKTFKSKERQMAHLFGHPSVRGVYEQKMSLEHRLILKLGAKCKAMSLNYDDFEIKSSSDYLKQGNFVFMLHHYQNKMHIVIFEDAVFCSDGLSVQFENVLYFKQQSLLFCAVLKYLERKKQCILVLSSNKNQFKASIPTIRLKHPEMPTLDWQRHVFNLWNKINFAVVLEEKLKLSRYCNVPICNLEDARQALDFIYARKLISNNYILWMSKELPDLGGKQEDDHFLLDLSLLFPEINNPNYYPNYSLHVEMFGLCVSCVLEMNYPVLGLMVKDMLKTNETLLVHFYHWITSTSSLLYDPYATNLIFNHMKKKFMQIIHEIQSLNGVIVHATFNQLILSTPKQELDQAKHYAEYLISHIKKCGINMMFNIVNYFTNLTHIDCFNYARFEDDELFMMFNMADYLPIDLKDIFLQYIASYFLKQTSKETLFDLVPMLLKQNLNDALNFIKFIMVILEQQNPEETRILRRNCLDMMQIKEFCLESQFKNPTNGLLIQMVCVYCNRCNEIDIIRSPSFFCFCGKEYQKSLLELNLIEILQNSITRYQLQDLVCSKCLKHKYGLLSQYCECSNFLNLEFEVQITNLQQCAQKLNFDLLKNLLLQINGH